MGERHSNRVERSEKADDRLLVDLEAASDAVTRRLGAQRGGDQPGAGLVIAVAGAQYARVKPSDRIPTFGGPSHSPR